MSEVTIHVPGVLRCAKCNFRLVKTTLCMADGEAYANNEPDQCPNCHVPMWRVSWKDEAKEAFAIAESQMKRALHAETLLTEAREVLGLLNRRLLAFVFATCEYADCGDDVDAIDRARALLARIDAEGV